MARTDYKKGMVLVRIRALEGLIRLAVQSRDVTAKIGWEREKLKLEKWLRDNNLEGGKANATDAAR